MQPIGANFCAYSRYIIETGLLMNAADNTPILVGVSQRTYRDTGNPNRTPTDALHDALELALQNSGRGEALRGAIDTLCTEPSLLEVSAELGALISRFPGPELVKRLGLKDARCLKAPDSGNGPQMLINHFAKELNLGQRRAVAICGGELTASFKSLLGGGGDISHWPNDVKGDTQQPWAERSGTHSEELRHNLWLPTHMYALFENALRHRYGHSLSEHQEHMGKIMQGLSDTAAANPDAWSYQRPRSAKQLVSFEERSPCLALPYNKYLCAQMNIDMAAAVIMTTVATARELGINEDQWIYLNGCADVNEVWYVAERADLSRSGAVALAGETALARAGCHIDDIALMDIYSCFPSAVEMACHALNIDPFGQRPLSITGGLPYFGGPGHGYSLHAVVTLVEQLRERPNDKGLITANGWYMTKESIGIYSAKPSEMHWQRGDDAALQAQIDAQPHHHIDDTPSGHGHVDSFTVVCDNNGPQQGIIIGSLDSGARFVAHTEQDDALFAQLMSEDVIGQRGVVSSGEQHNLFRFK
jgi:acetyl-CoA C-acetyltransferase